MIRKARLHNGSRGLDLFRQKLFTAWNADKHKGFRAKGEE